MDLRVKFFYLICSFLGLFIPYCQAAVYVLPNKGDVVGKIQHVGSEVNETIEDVGRRWGIGYYEMINANPKVDARNTLSANTSLIIPSQFILPPGPRRGIVINLAEYRLYYFPPDENVVFTFPIGIGKKGWSTPVGSTKVTAKVTHPTWRPTTKVLAAAEQIGAPLPEVFPPGPNNPLGDYALRLSWPSFLIHGTNIVDGIGARVSAGCIRMLPSDIEYLYQMVSVGTQVRIINEPIKMGKIENQWFFQAHPSLSDHKKIKLKDLLVKKLSILNIKKIDSSIYRELTHPSGLIIPISETS
ncbi:L,D-transpeptidase family protein [Legionella sp. km772]|uniref:L,D-transpeptidase family protein n=1 Tax=Legionella sp. km772 TaxID=2498111 RepID=UPI000F8DFBD1|nr:L,D-transpeptidase family protein [Legionella sp. km772]RUR13208.1 L,D-transpeptidase [Legionella sp. km772]